MITNERRHLHISSIQYKEYDHSHLSFKLRLQTQAHVNPNSPEGIDPDKQAAECTFAHVKRTLEYIDYIQKNTYNYQHI